MKKKLCLCLLILMILLNATCGFCQGKDKVIYSLKRDGGNYAVDSKGRVLFFNFYDGMGDYHGGLIGFMESNKTGFLSKKGKVIIEPLDFFISDFNEYITEIIDPNSYKSGFMDTTGQIIIEPEYEMASPDGFQKGYCPVKKNGKYGVINPENTVMIPFEYDLVFRYSEGLFPACRNGKWGFINKDNQIVIPFEYDTVDPFSEGLARAGQNGKEGFIDKKGKWVVKPIYDRVLSYSEGVAGVLWYEGENKWSAYLNHKGKPIFPPSMEWSDIGPFSEGLAAVDTKSKRCDSWGYINRKSELVIDYRFDSVEDFREGSARVYIGSILQNSCEKEKSEHYIIDKKGNVLF